MQQFFLAFKERLGFHGVYVNRGCSMNMRFIHSGLLRRSDLFFFFFFFRGGGGKLFIANEEAIIKKNKPSIRWRVLMQGI